MRKFASLGDNKFSTNTVVLHTEMIDTTLIVIAGVEQMYSVIPWTPKIQSN